MERWLKVNEEGFILVGDEMGGLRKCLGVQKKFYGIWFFYWQVKSDCKISAITPKYFMLIIPPPPPPDLIVRKLVQNKKHKLLKTAILLPLWMTNIKIYF